MNKHICIITHQHLCRNPRVFKEALAISAMGDEVTILSSIYSSNLLLEDEKLIGNEKIKYRFYSNLSKKGPVNYLNRFSNKMGRLLTRMGFENRWALGYAPDRCLQLALRENADLYIVHQELPTYVGKRLIRRGKKVGFDFEDWYSQDLLENAQNYRPDKLLANAEKIGLTKGIFSYTTSNAMALAMQIHYSLTTPPKIVYNTFNAYADPLPRNTSSLNKLIWLSQTIGPGRGLEELISAMDQVTSKSFSLHLRGQVTSEYKEELKKLLQNNLHELHFLPLLPNDKIAESLAGYDLGLALEPTSPPNKNLTLSNKIFHYLSVGIPVIASSTLGQLDLRNDFKSSIFYFETTGELVSILSNFTRYPQVERENILFNYQKKYDWKIQSETITALVKKI